MLSFSLLALAGGVSIYVFFRNAVPAWVEGLGVPAGLRSLPGLSMLLRQNSPVRAAFINSFPDGAWLLSGLLMVRSVWIAHRKPGDVYVFVFCLAALFLELIQLAETIPGTFDGGDLLFLGAAVLCEELFYKIIIIRGIQVYEQSMAQS
jgi:hypothetical protein